MTRFCSFLVSFFKRNYPLVCTAVIVSNFVLSCTCWRSLSDRHFYHTVTNEVFTTCTITQVVSSSSFVTNCPSLVSPSSSVDQVDHPCEDYLYFLVDGRKCVRLWGRPYFAGSVTSYGRILDVYPDRCLLVGGGSITNNDKRRYRNDIGTIVSTP